MQGAEAPRNEGDLEQGAYPQPTPRLLYVHDDLSDEVERRLGAASPAAALTRSLFELLGDGERVVILTVAQQVERVVARQGPRSHRRVRASQCPSRAGTVSHRAGVRSCITTLPGIVVI